MSSIENNEVIRKVSFCGLSLYKRTRLINEPVLFKTEPITVDDLGLFVVTQNPSLTFNDHSIFTERNWMYFSQETIFLVISNLLFNGSLELVRYKDRIEYLEGIIDYKNDGFYLKRKGYQNIKDLLSKKILNIIDDSTDKNKDSPELKTQLSRTIDVYLGKTKEYNKPGKSFIKNLLKSYSANPNNWFILEEETKLLGLSKEYRFQILDKEFDKIIKSHLNFKQQAYSFEQPSYSTFKKELFTTIESEFKRRIPSSYDDNDDTF